MTQLHVIVRQYCILVKIEITIWRISQEPDVIQMCLIYQNSSFLEYFQKNITIRQMQKHCRPVLLDINSTLFTPDICDVTDGRR